MIRSNFTALQFKGTGMKLRLLATITITLVVYCGSAIADDANLGELSLRTADELFRSNSREFLSAKRMVESAQAGAVIAGQKSNPVLSLGLSNFNLNHNQVHAKSLAAWQAIT